MSLTVWNPGCIQWQTLCVSTASPLGAHCFSSTVTLKGSPSVASSEAHAQNPGVRCPAGFIADAMSVTFHPDGAVCSDAPIDLPGIGARGQTGREAKSACSGLLVLGNKEIVNDATSPSAPAPGYAHQHPGESMRCTHACNKPAVPKNPGILIEG